MLTRDRSYEKKPEPMRAAYKKLLSSMPAMIGALDRRSEVYNAQCARLFELEEEGRAIVVAPKQPLAISRFEKDKEKLKAAYAEGMADAREVMQARREVLRCWGMLG